VNLYGYVSNNPVNWIDPDGLATIVPNNPEDGCPPGMLCLNPGRVGPAFSDPAGYVPGLNSSHASVPVVIGLSRLNASGSKNAVGKNGSECVTNAYSHGYNYHPRIRIRGVQDPKAHNFPYSFDDQILSTHPIIQDDGSLLYSVPGFMNQTNGHYQIAINPETNTIFHRTFVRY